MELRTLGYIEAVARLGTFTAAAAELHVAQPAVSAQIAAAERELGAALFVRSRQGARPTPAGDLVVARARRLHAEMVGLRAEVDELNGLIRGTLTIGATPLLGPIDLPAMAARFRADHPGITLRIRTALIGDLVKEVERGGIDLAFGPIHDPRAPQLAVHELHRERVVLIAPTGRDRPVRRLRDVAEDPFVCLGPASGLRGILEAACARAGFTPQVEIEVSTPHQIREYVAAGLGVALVAGSVAAGDGPAVEVTELRSPPSHPPLGIITTSTPSPAARAFVDRARAWGAQPASPTPTDR